MGKNKKILLLIFVTVITLLLSSCNYDKIKDKDKSVNVENRDKETVEILRRSEEIADLVVDLIGIENATSIIFQDIALIGISFFEENEVGLSEDLKKSIEKLVLENDEGINRVLISDDENIFIEIEEILQGLLREEHIKSYTNDLNKLFQRMDNK